MSERITETASDGRVVIRNKRGMFDPPTESTREIVERLGHTISENVSASELPQKDASRLFLLMGRIRKFLG